MTQRIALVTGGTGGIGTAICHALSGAGVKVVAGYNAVLALVTLIPWNPDLVFCAGSELLSTSISNLVTAPCTSAAATTRSEPMSGNWRPIKELSRYAPLRRPPLPVLQKLSTVAPALRTTHAIGLCRRHILAEVAAPHCWGA